MPEDEPASKDILAPQTDERQIIEVLRRLGICLRLPVDASTLNLGDVPQSQLDEDPLGHLMAGALEAGIYIAELELSADDVTSSLAEGFPVILAMQDGSFWVFETLVGSKIEASHVTTVAQQSYLSQRQVNKLFRSRSKWRTFITKRELECDTLTHRASSAGGGHYESGHHEPGEHPHPKPLRRFLSLLKLDQRDIWTVILFALVSGILSLATPLAIESLVNVVSWGTYLQPLIVLGLMLMACLGIAGILKLLQTMIVEIVQRRQLVRIVGDLAHRFPRADQSALHGEYPRELANRVFDIMTIQKASAVLLLDGISIALTTILGLLLLAFYHPYLLGFDIALMICMISVTWLLGRGGVGTAIDESVTKYRIAHWLQDILATPAAFKLNGGELLAIERANRLTTDYLVARQQQFRVVIRQVAFAIGLQVVASTFLLGLGGWLVMQRQLTLGQLVASELVVTVVVGAFAKAGKSLETFYDLMAAIDKVGHLLDIPVDPRYELGDIPDGPVGVRWDDLGFQFQSTGSSCEVPANVIAPGARLAIVGNDRAGKSLLIRSLAGLVKPQFGMAEVAGFEAQRAALAGAGRLVGYANSGEIFHATIEENVDVGRTFVGHSRVRDVLVQVGLWDTILRLPMGVRTQLLSNGSPLSSTQQAQLIIARAMAGKPRLLLIDSLLDELVTDVRETLWAALSAKDAPWTLVLVTNHRPIAELCETQLELKGH